MSNLRKIQARSANNQDGDSSSLNTTQASSRVNLYSTPNDHLAALVNANEKSAERDSKMKSLFAKGKTNKDQGLMQLHRTQWATEYRRLHTERRSLEAEVESALAAMSSLLMADIGQSNTTSTSTVATPLSSSVTQLPIAVAAKGLHDEFCSDASVTNTIANRVLSEVFNLKASVAGAGARGKEIAMARDILEGEQSRTSQSGSRTVSSGTLPRSGNLSGALPQHRANSSARAAGNTASSRTQLPPRVAPTSSLATTQSARVPPQSSSSASATTTAATAISMTSNRHRSATMTSPEEEVQLDPEEKLLTNPHRLTTSELSALDAKYKTEVTRLQHSLTQIKASIEDELLEWNTEGAPEVKWRKSCSDYLGSMMKDLVSLDSKKGEVVDIETEQIQYDQKQDARIELGRLLTAAGVAPSLIASSDPTTSGPPSLAPTNVNDSQDVVGQQPQSNFGGSQLSTATAITESTQASAAIALETLEANTDEEISLLTRRYAGAPVAHAVVVVSRAHLAGTVEGGKTEQTTTMQPPPSALDALDAAFRSSSKELIGLFRAAITEKLMGLRDEVEGDGGGALEDDEPDMDKEYGKNVRNEAKKASLLTRNSLSSMEQPTKLAPTSKQEMDVHTNATGVTAANTTSGKISLTSSLSSARLRAVDSSIVDRIRVLLPQYQQHRKALAASTTVGSMLSTTSRKPEISAGATDLTSNKSKELFHHRVQLEFPTLSQHQIVSICRAIADESRQSAALNAKMKATSAEVAQLLQHLRNALQAEEASVFVERERLEWAAAEAARRSEALVELEALREAKQVRDAAALEERMANEETQRAALEKKTALRQAEFDERLRRLATYQQEKSQLEEREKVLADQEAAILAEEGKQRSEYNKTRVAARDKKTQEALDQLRLEKLEIEQQLAEKEAQKERFFAAVQSKLGVERDPLRAIQLTESKKNNENNEILLGEATAMKGRHGFTDEDILKDPRFRIHQALLSAGLQNTSYARDLISNGCGYKMSRHNTMSEGPGSFW